MADLLIQRGMVLDPSQGFEGPAAILVREGRVDFLGEEREARVRALPEVEVLDVSGKIVTPGWIDMHVHFRQPGMEEEETIASGASAAVHGGFTAVACMPNTDPPLDTQADILFVYREAQRTGKAQVFPVGSITAGRKGEDLAEMGQMAEGGAVAFSDDGTAVPTAGLLRKAMEYATMLGKPILEHCEDLSLAADGVMNEGYISTILGLPGIPKEAEEIIVARDIALAKLTGARLHLQHISTAGSVEMLRRAKEAGVRVTAEVTPHHLVLTEEAVVGYNPVFKMNPPLRSAEDVEACIEGLREGVIDAIASDHAPHLREEKELEFIYAPCGVIGLETTVSVLYTKLVATGRISLRRMVEALTVAPSRILQLGRGTLRPGSPADLTIFDPEIEWTVNPSRFQSKSRNCPFAGWTLRGKAVATIVAGQIVYADPAWRRG